MNPYEIVVHVVKRDQPPGTMVHPQRESPLHAGHLVVVELHRIDRPTPILVVPSVGTEYAREQDTGAGSQGVNHSV